MSGRSLRDFTVLIIEHVVDAFVTNRKSTLKKKVLHKILFRFRSYHETLKGYVQILSVTADVSNADDKKYFLLDH
jgi:hypothetical protein